MNSPDRIFTSTNAMTKLATDDTIPKKLQECKVSAVRQAAALAEIAPVPARHGEQDYGAGEGQQLVQGRQLGVKGPVRIQNEGERVGQPSQRGYGPEHKHVRPGSPVLTVIH